MRCLQFSKKKKLKSHENRNAKIDAVAFLALDWLNILGK